MNTLSCCLMLAAFGLAYSIPAYAQHTKSSCLESGQKTASCCESAKKVKSCCQLSANDEFAMLGNDPSFALAHASPEPINYTPHGGRMITIPCPDGKEARAFMVANAPTSKNYLLIIHEWWGLNEHIMRESERLFHEVHNTHIIAIDLYDGQQATNAEDASKLMQGADEKRIRAILTGVLNHAGEDAVIQTIGWRFGGTWSLQASLMAGQRAVGCVVYYGQPETDTKKLSALQAPLLGIYADRDDWITPAVVNDFEKDLEKLKKTYTIKRYDAVHAFANPSNPNYHREYAGQAQVAANEFLNKNFAAKRQGGR